MADRGGQTARDGTEQTGSGMTTAATGFAVNATSAGTQGGAESAGAENPHPPLEGGDLGHVDGVARPVQEGKISSLQRRSPASFGRTPKC